MHPLIPRAGLVVSLASLLAATSAAATSAAWDPVQELRSIPAGKLLSVEDIAGLGSSVVVGWQEGEGDPRSFVRWSTDAGSTWGLVTALDMRQRREPQVDTCAGRAWAASGLHEPAAPPGQWLIVIDGFDMSGPPVESSLATSKGESRAPDIACAGNRRLAVASFRRVGAGYRVRLFSRGVAQPLEALPPEVTLDLGKGALAKGISIAATKNRIHVAFFVGDRLDVHRFAVGPGPEHAITALPVSTFGSLPNASHPVLAAARSRVVLAYMHEADLKARVSADKGATWGRARVLRDEPFPSEIGALPTNADVRGKRIVVSGVEIGGIETPSGKGFLYRSTDGGRRWSRVRGSSKAGSKAVGAFMTPGGRVRMVQAWDDSLGFEAAMDPQALRFRRQR
jgi:hypothetical protein